MTAIHKEVYKIVRKICLENYAEKDWFYKGLTYLIPKGTPKSGKDFRPIKCMSNLYKLVTKCATATLQEFVEAKSLLCEN